LAVLFWFDDKFVEIYTFNETLPEIFTFYVEFSEKIPKVFTFDEKFVETLLGVFMFDVKFSEKLPDVFMFVVEIAEIFSINNSFLEILLFVEVILFIFDRYDKVCMFYTLAEILIFVSFFN
jgi:hypothetical protein